MKKELEVIILLLLDLLTLTISLEISLLLRKSFLPSFIGFPEFLEAGIITYWWVFPVWISFIVYEGLLTKRFSFWDEVKNLWRAVFFSTITVFSIIFLGKLAENYSRTVIVLMGLISLFIFPAIRINVKKILRHMGIMRSKVLIIGAGKRGKVVARALKEETNLGYKVVGFLDDNPRKTGTFIDGIKVHKGIDKAERYIGRSGINAVVIAIPETTKGQLNAIINRLQHKAESIFFVPDIMGIAVLGTRLQHFFREQAFALEIQNNLAKPFNMFIKRSFDLTVGSLLFLFLCVPMAIIALLIMLDSSGPAFFSQERIGRRGKSFRCFKFRTMYTDAEYKLTEILQNNSEANNEWEQYWKLKDDPRVTRVGKFLRKTSLDELPQIFNVLRGEMSLVGPRPVTQDEIYKYYQDIVELYYSVFPGVTGLWQVSGRSDTSYDYRVSLDSWYVRNWNLWLDVVILLRTAKVVLKREGAW